MSIPYICPRCYVINEVPDEDAGQKKPCASCGHLVAIPYSDKAPPPIVLPANNAVAESSGIGWQVVKGVLAAATILGIFAVLLLPSVGRRPTTSRRAWCQNNLKQIGIALANYHIVHKTFPPAYFADENGKPKHSWRVLILPFLEENLLYYQYNFNEPWDSPGNLKVAKQMPSAFACPDIAETGSQQTSYQVIVGAGTAFPGANGCTMAQIKDGSSNTLMVVESASPVIWTQPADLEFDKMHFNISGGPGEIGSEHPGGGHAVFCDGSVRPLDRVMDPSIVKAMATRDGGESVDDTQGDE